MQDQAYCLERGSGVRHQALVASAPAPAWTWTFETSHLGLRQDAKSIRALKGSAQQQPKWGPRVLGLATNRLA